MTLDEMIAGLEEVERSVENDLVIIIKAQEIGLFLFTPERQLAKTIENRRKSDLQKIKRNLGWFRELKRFREQENSMTNKALASKPCEDAISRQAVFDAIITLWADKPFGNPALTEIKECIERVPSVNPLYTEDEIQKMQELEQAEIQKAYEFGKSEEPKTVLYRGDGYYDGELVYDFAECPECGYEYEDGDKDWGLPFCPKCGQSLNWESEVEE